MISPAHRGPHQRCGYSGAGQSPHGEICQQSSEGHNATPSEQHDEMEEVMLLVACSLSFAALIRLAVDIHPHERLLDARLDQQAVAVRLPEGIAPRLARPVLADRLQIKGGQVDSLLFPGLNDQTITRAKLGKSDRVKGDGMPIRIGWSIVGQ